MRKMLIPICGNVSNRNLAHGSDSSSYVHFQKKHALLTVNIFLTDFDNRLRQHQLKPTIENTYHYLAILKAITTQSHRLYLVAS